MSLVLADGVKETTTTTGTGTLSLLGAPTGLRTFVAGAGNGSTCPYRVDDGLGNWEETWGTVTSGTPDTLSRGTLIASSTGGRITFGAGTKTVAIVPMVELLVSPAASAVLGETTIASATTTDLGTSTTLCVAISGTTTITGFGTQPYSIRFVRFITALTLTHNAVSLILTTSANRTTAAGDVGIYISDASGNWREYSYTVPSQGTWTPSLGGSATYTAQTGTYTKIGRMVTLRWNINVNLIGTGGTTQIAGLPFPAAAAGDYAGSCLYFFNSVTSFTSLVPYIAASSSLISFSCLTAAAAAMTLGPTIFKNGTQVEGTITYEATG